MKPYVFIFLLLSGVGHSFGQTCSGSLTSSTTAPCLNQPFTLTTSYHSSMAIVNWEVSENPSGPWTNIGTSNINQFSGIANFTITPTTPGVYYYRAVLPTCTYAPITITVGANPPPTPPTVTAMTTCPTVTLTVPQSGTNTIAWYENQGFFWNKISGQTGTSLVVAHSTGTYQYYAVYENPSCASSASNEISIGQYGIAPYVSTATSTDVNFVYNTGNGLVMQKDNCDKLLLSFQGSGNNRMKGKVTIDGVINSYNGQPYLQRHYDLNPAPNAMYPTTPATYSAQLFFTQAEFDAFNVATSPETPKLPREPNGTYGHFNANGNFVTDPTNSEIYYGNSEQVNLRVLKAAGEPTVSGGGPETYSSVNTLVNPANCSGFGCTVQTNWNSYYQVWQVTLLNLTSFSGFFISTTNAAPMPVRLTNFTARGNETAIDLNWKTSAETSFSHYEIQRSEQAASGFEAIGRVNNQNNPSGGTYAFRDGQASVGQWYYYRLRMVDLDGTYQYSKIVAARIGQEVQVRVFPNPVRSELTFTADEPVVEYQLISPSGIVVQRKAGLRTDRERVTLPSLPAGTYLLRLQMESGRTETRNVVIM